MLVAVPLQPDGSDAPFSLPSAPTRLLATDISSKLTELAHHVIDDTRKLVDTYQLNPRSKEDGSWITDADVAAHNFLCQALPAVVDVPVLSEEGFPDFEGRREWSSYWLIDPIDNTKALVYDELSASSVSIALIVDGAPALAYVAYLDGSRSFHAEGTVVAFYSSSTTPRYLASSEAQRPLRFIGYRPSLSQMSPETRVLLQRLGADDGHLVHADRLFERFWRIINSEAEVYIEPRRLPAWDVAPHICACLAQGGSVISLCTGRPLNFNSLDMRVDPFVVGRRGVDTSAIVERCRS